MKTKLVTLVLFAFVQILFANQAKASVDLVNLGSASTGGFPAEGTVLQGNQNIFVTTDQSSNRISIFNITNKNNPVLITSTTTSQPDAIASVGNYVYVGRLGPTLSTYDLSSTTNPVISSSYSFGGVYNVDRVRIFGNYLYAILHQNAFAGPGGFAIFDITNPASPSFIVKVNYSPNTSGGGDVVIRGNYAYLADYFAKGLRVYDISNISSPTSVQTITGIVDSTDYAVYEPWLIGYKDNALYVMDDNVIRIYDISSSTNASYATSTLAGKDIAGYFISGNLMFYSSNGENGHAVGQTKLQVLDISNTFAPNIISELNNGLSDAWIVLDNAGYIYM